MSEAQRPVLEDDEQPVDPERESAYGISRLMAFSDGVFSIAITLLVLDVPVPVIAQSDTTSRLPAALLHTGPRILTFALSFFLVGFYWIRHHQLFSRLVSANVWLLWLNLVVLFFVCMLPFSSGVVGRYGDTVAGAEVYAVNLAAIALAFSALHLYAIRGRQVLIPKGAGTGFVSRGLYLPLVVVALVMVVAPVNEVVLRLPRPSGTVPVRIFGGAERISMQRPDGTAVRSLVRGGVGRLQLDARLVEADGEGTLVESPDYADVADRYDVELAGGAADISISSV